MSKTNRRPDTQDDYILFRCDADWKRRIKVYAKSKGQTMSAWVRVVLTQALNGSRRKAR